MRAAGKLNRKITIEAKSVAMDPDYGTEVITWVPVATRIWASIQDVLPSRSEQVKQGIRVATLPARLRIRYRTDITSAMRVTVHGATDTVYQIVGGPAEVGRRELIEMMIEAYSS